MAGELDLMLIFAAAMTMLEMLVLAAFATLFAVLTRPILGSLMTLAVFVVGHMSADLWLLTSRLPGALTRAVIAVVYYLLPNLERFNFRTEVVHDLSIPQRRSVGPFSTPSPSLSWSLPRQPPFPGQGSEVKRTLGSLAIVAILLGAVVLSEVRLGKIAARTPSGAKLLYLPSPEMLKIMSLGNPGLVADVVVSVVDPVLLVLSSPRALSLSRDRSIT